MRYTTSFLRQTVSGPSQFCLLSEAYKFGGGVIQPRIVTKNEGCSSGMLGVAGSSTVESCRDIFPHERIEVFDAWCHISDVCHEISWKFWWSWESRIVRNM